MIGGEFMKITFEEINDDVIYRISDFDPKYEKIFQMCFYQNDGKGYIKKYPKKSKYIEKMKRRYYENAQLMFDQLGYFSDVPWEMALKSFCQIINGKDINWWLTGSCATCIRGIELNPHDLDIMIDSKNVDELTELFSNYLIEPIINTDGWLTKDFGVIFLHARIDIASDPAAILDEPEPIDCGPYAQSNLEVLDWAGFKIKVPPLELQLTVNRKRGRLDRVEKIEEYLRAGQ